MTRSVLESPVYSLFPPHRETIMPDQPSKAPERSNVVYRVEIKQLWRATTRKKEWRKVTDEGGKQQYDDVVRDVDETGERVIFVAESASQPSLVALAKLIEGTK